MSGHVARFTFMEKNMSRFDEANAWGRPAGAFGAVSAAEFDAGLRKHMLSVYNYMASGLLLTGAIALFVAQSPGLMAGIHGTPLKFVVMLAPLAFVMVLSFGIERLSASAMQGIFWAFSATMGLSLSSIFMVYTGASIAEVFFISAATFAVTSLYGYTTQRDLTGFGGFLFMGLIGIVIASLVNLFLASSMLQFVISVIGVLVFTGLTAYDTQKIKEGYADSWSEESKSKVAIMGALTLYLDLINIFMMLLQLLGNRRD